MNKHISIDIESLATTPDAVILSIGAVVFDATRHYTTFYAKLRRDEQSRRRKSTETLAWWEQQDEKAREVLKPDGMEPVLFALGRLSEFVIANPHEGVWALGPHFDIAAIEHLYAEFGLPAPWDYRAPRDMRTVRAQFNKQFPAGELPESIGIKHHALADASRQATALQHMNQQLGGHIL